MSDLRALVIGGNGIISSSVSRLAVERGFEVTVVNRGLSADATAARRGTPPDG